MFLKLFNYFLLSVVAVVSLCGCASYDVRVQNSRNEYLSGNYSAAIVSLPKKNSDTLYPLVMGKLEQLNCNITNSTANFNRAEIYCDEQEASAKIDLAKNAKAILTSEAFTKYTFTPTDSIMLSTYQALNSWSLDPNITRVHITRAFERQKMFLFYNQKELEKIEAEATENTNFAMMKDSGEFDRILNDQMSSAPNLPPIKSLENPYTLYIDALYHQYCGTDSSDRERARFNYAKLSQIVPNNSVIKDDLARTSNASEPESNVCYIIYESGTAPQRYPVEINIPVLSFHVPYIGIAFPKLSYARNNAPNISILSSGKQSQTEALASISALVKRDFDNVFPGILTRAITSSLVKAAATYAAQESVSGQSLSARLAVSLVSATYSASTNVADTRCWWNLPDQVSIAKVAIPQNRTIAIRHAGANRSVKLNDGKVMLLLVQAPRSTNNLSINQIKIK